MTSKTSSAKIHPVGSFLKFSLKKQTPLTLLVTAFTLIICPGMLIRGIIMDLSYSNKFVLDSDDYNMYAFFILGASAVLMFMLLLNNFGFLYSKKAEDMFGALPLTRNEMLVTRGLSSYIGALVNMTVSYLGLCTLNFLPPAIVEGVSLKTVILTYLFMVLILTVLTVYSLLFVICSGGYLNTIIAFAAINLAPVFIVAILILNATESAIGLELDYISVIYFSPVAYMFWKFMCIPRLEDVNATLLNLEKISVWTVIGLLLFAVVCGVIASKLFAVRKSETAGEAYSFKFMPAIMTVLVSMVGGYLVGGILSGFNEDFDVMFWILFVIGSLLCAVTLGAVISRGFKTVKKSLINGAVSAAVMIALVLATTVSANIAELRIPQADKIQEIRLFYDEDVVFTENFGAVIDLHTKITENIKNDYETDDEDYHAINNTFIRNADGIRIKYIMKNGSAIAREYWHGYPDMDNLYPELLRLMQTDEFIARYYDCVTDSIDDIVTVSFRGEEYTYKEYEYYERSAVFGSSQGKALLETFGSEVKAADISIFDEACYVISIHGNTFEELYIPVSFTKTMDFLSQHLIVNEETKTETVFIE